MIFETFNGGGLVEVLLVAFVIVIMAVVSLELMLLCCFDCDFEVKKDFWISDEKELKVKLFGKMKIKYKARG